MTLDPPTLRAPLIEAVQNVRYGRMALRQGCFDAAQFHLDIARDWLRRVYDGGPRSQRVLGHVNRFACDLLFAVVATGPWEAKRETKTKGNA